MPNKNPVQEVMIHPGMSEAIDARLLPGPRPGETIARPRLLQNLRVRQGQRFEKRPGTLSRGTTGLPTAGSALWMGEWSGLDVAAIEDTLDSQLARTLYIRDASGQWNYGGRHGCVVPERRTGITFDDSVAAGSGFRGQTCVAISGIVYVAWAESGAIVHLQAMDPSGTILRDVTLSSADNPRLVYANSILRLVYRNGTDIGIRTVTLDTLALSAATTLGGVLAGASSKFDAAPMEGGTTWLLAYPSSAVAITVRVITGVSLTHTATITTTNLAEFVSVVGTNGSKVVCAYADGTAAQVSTFSDTLTGGAETTIQTATGSEVWTCQSGIVRTASNEWHVVFGGTDQSAAPTIQVWMLYHARISGTPAVTEGAYKGYRFLPCSKPFTTGDAGSRRVSVVAHDADTAGLTVLSSHVILDLETQGSPHGGGQQLSAISYEHQPWFDSNTKAHNTEVASLGDGRFFCPVTWYEPNGQRHSAGQAGVAALVFRSTMASQSMAWSQRVTREVNAALLVSGGALYESSCAQLSGFDYIVENGFANDPIINTAVAAGGSLTSGKLYSYLAVYAWVDPIGRVHRSAPSVADTVTPSGGNLSVTVRIAGIGCSGRFGTNSGAVIAEVYRSWDGGPYYFVKSTTSNLGGTLSVTLTDTASDTTVSANRQIYSDGSSTAASTPNEPPSGARLLCVGGCRVWTVGWKERVVEFSKLIRDDTPVEFCDSNSFRVFGFTDAITALGWMDGAAVVFARQRIWIVTGDGPDDQGNGVFFTPRELPAAVGADSPHVAEGPAGLFFSGAGTIWLLPRGFGPPRPVGEDIQETLADFPYLRGAVRCANADDDCIHFTLANADLPTAETKVAVWDNRLDAWRLDDIAGEIGAAGAVDGKFTWLLPTWDSANDVPVRQLSTSSTQDLAANNATATWIESRIGFGDWRPFGALGWGTFTRIQVHLEAIGRCVAKLDVSVDHGDKLSTTVTKTFSLESGPKYLEYGMAQVKGTAFRFDLYDAEDSGKTRGLLWHALAIEATPEQGMRRIDPTTERFS